MLDTLLHQGSGLHPIAQPQAPRALALASLGNPEDEMGLLWQLCSALGSAGYPVAVLDGNTVETEAHPGLEQLIEDAYWRPAGTDLSSTWTVMPAALGLRSLCETAHEAETPLAPLARLFGQHGVVLVYAEAGILTRLLRDSGTRPLLAISATGAGSTRAYETVKRLVLEAGLMPRLTGWMDSTDPASGDASRLQRLQQCALRFLGCRLEATLLPASGSTPGASDSLHRLALRLLESAQVLSPAPSWARAH